MQSVELEDYNHDSLLESVHLDVEHLFYDSDEPMESWQQLSRAFPRLRKLTFEDLGRVGGRKEINAEFFQQFPNLSELEMPTRSRDKLSVRLENVNPEHLANLEKLKLSQCRDEDLALLSSLPKLTELTVRLYQSSVKVAISDQSSLKVLKVGLESQVSALSCDLENSQLTSVVLGQLDYYDDGPAALSVNQLCLPSSLQEFTLDAHCVDKLPGSILGANQNLNQLTLNLGSAELAEDLLGELKELNRLTLTLTEPTPPLPPALFAKLTRATKFELKCEQTQIPGLLLPHGMVVEDFNYRNASGALEQANELVLPKLTRAWVFGLNGDQLDWLAHSPKLNDCNFLLKGKVSQMPELPELTSLTLRGGELEQLPASVLSSSTIERLNLLSVTLPRLGDMSQMTALADVWIQPWRHEQASLPDQQDLVTIPALESLRLDIELNQFDPAWINLNAELKLDISSEKLAAEWQILKRSHLSDEESLGYLNILAPVYKPADLPTMPANFHLTMMAAKYNRFKAQHKAWLSQLAQHNQHQRPFGADSILFVSGRSGFKATELKAKAEEVGFSLSKKLDDKVTHILLGSAPKNTESFDLDRHAIIDDSVLQQCFKANAPKFLQQQGGESMEASVLEMLASPDEASHKVAVQMLEQGGVTEAMRLPLFLILKTTADNGFRKQIKHLLAGMGDEAFQLAVNDRILFHNCRGLDDYGNLKGQGVMVDKLKKQRRKWGDVLCMEFAQLFFRRYGEGLIYVMLQKTPAELRLSMLESLVEGDCLNWRRGMGMDQIQEFWNRESQINLHWHPMFYLNRDNLLGAVKVEIPKELANGRTIRRLDLGNCLLSTLPKGADQFTEITSLSLAHNMLDSLPSAMTKFTQLEELDLSFNHFREFPKVLLKMPWLKKLDFRRATRPGLDDDYGSHYHKLRVPQAFLEACPECEVLQD